MGTKPQKQARQDQFKEEGEKTTTENNQQKDTLYAPPSNVTAKLGWLHAFVAFQPQPTDFRSVVSPPIRETALMRDLTAHK